MFQRPAAWKWLRSHVIFNWHITACCVNIAKNHTFYKQFNTMCNYIIYYLYTHILYIYKLVHSISLENIHHIRWLWIILCDNSKLIICIKHSYRLFVIVINSVLCLFGWFFFLNIIEIVQIYRWTYVPYKFLG